MFTVLSVCMLAVCAADSDWLSHGLTEFNTRNVNDVDNSNPINSGNVATLMSSWNFTTNTSSTATPAIKGSVVFECSFNGYLYAINKISGALTWEVRIGDLSGRIGDFCRSTPAIKGDTMIIGTQTSGYILALNCSTGDLLWKIRPNPHPLASWTMSGTIFDGYVYMGASSSEESASVDPSYPCCSFRGSFHKINVQTGEIAWTFWASIRLCQLVLETGRVSESGGAVLPSMLDEIPSSSAQVTPMASLALSRLALPWHKTPPATHRRASTAASISTASFPWTCPRA